MHFKFDERKKYLYLIAVVLFVLVVVYRIKPFLVQLTPSNDEIVLKEATLVKYRKIIKPKEKKVAMAVYRTQPPAFLVKVVITYK